MSEIKLEVGKRYETRGGDWIGVVTGRDASAAGTHNEFVGYSEFSDGYKTGERTWRSDGRFSDYEEGVGDLIREIPDEQPAQGEPQTIPGGREATPEEEAAAFSAPDTNAPLRLEVGKTYRARNGRAITIKKFDSEDAGPWVFLSIGGSWYSVDGRWAGQDVMNVYDGGLDLIEEIPAPVAEAADTLDFKIKYESPTISAVRPEPPRMDASLTATEGPATEKVVAHWDRERFIGIEAGASTSAGADDAWLRANLADTRAGIARKYAQAAMFVMLGVAAIVFAIGTSVQA